MDRTAAISEEAGPEPGFPSAGTGTSTGARVIEPKDLFFRTPDNAIARGRDGLDGSTLHLM
ncbi:hypothetical protein GCM10010136_26340 [Limoniibacter endophyticus]|uniref:Uncharacterized protein n=1 Tax=Limoniibacter endophyticus TaxID=1565040 RepID=A0A8J3DK00_9HYPH|nr:hypothetical protein GCM10010136_26340 [Limoniibacter endophyticus]